MKQNDDSAPPKNQNPAELAREAFRQLASRRIAPTPDAYRDIYDEIAGVSSVTQPDPGAAQVLADFAHAVLSLNSQHDDIKSFGNRLDTAARASNWSAYADTLNDLSAAYLIRSPEAVPKELVSSPVVAAPTKARSALVDEHQTQILRDLLTRTLLVAVTGLLSSAPQLATETEALGRAVKDANTEDALNEIGTKLKQLCFRIEMRAADMAEEQELLLRLFKLLLDNVSELVDEGSWLHGQIDGVQNLLAGPINHHALQDATRSLKDVIYKQGTLKHSLTEAKVTVKTMMMTFIDRLGALATSTGDYHEKIDLYSRKISQAPDIAALNSILEDVMRDTRSTQSQALRSRDEMLATHLTVQDTEKRIHDLESKLEQMSDLVREDQLTGSLNRRGLEDVLERELARADRRGSPLCIAMLDLDDFKRLNDKHGHQAGDEALVYLVRVIKDTLRTMDVIARFGGEEFLILLPDTALPDALHTVTRVQRELTKRIFMHNNERLLITFSAGVALRDGAEVQAALIKRADAALYKAKRAGKNRVISAE